MKVILDTHVLIWMVSQSEVLSGKVRKLLDSSSTELWVSSASVFEIATKWRIGKLPGFDTLIHRLEESLAEIDAKELAITHRHAKYAGMLEMVHKDPFDRILIAQSLIEGIPLVSRDHLLDKYGISRIW